MLATVTHIKKFCGGFEVITSNYVKGVVNEEYYKEFCREWWVDVDDMERKMKECSI